MSSTCLHSPSVCQSASPQQQLYLAERDLTQARYAYLLSHFRLRSVAGALDLINLQEMKDYFISQRFLIGR